MFSPSPGHRPQWQSPQNWLCHVLPSTSLCGYVAMSWSASSRSLNYGRAYTVCCMPHIDYVIQYVTSLGRSMTFYRDVIGLKVRIEGDGYVEFEMENTKFSLFESSKLPELIGRQAGTAPCSEIGFIIDDVDAEAERLKGLGVEILTGPIDRPWGERTLHIADPDGNIIEFAQKLR